MEESIKGGVDKKIYWRKVQCMPNLLHGQQIALKMIPITYISFFTGPRRNEYNTVTNTSYRE